MMSWVRASARIRATRRNRAQQGGGEHQDGGEREGRHSGETEAGTGRRQNGRGAKDTIENERTEWAREGQRKAEKGRASVGWV
jgi:hypothetical protein